MESGPESYDYCKGWPWGMVPKCCVECFHHEWLREYVVETSNALGDCDYCGSQGVTVIAISALYEPFSNLMQLYVPSNELDGEMLTDILLSA